MSMCVVCWFDGRRQEDEIERLRLQLRDSLVAEEHCQKMWDKAERELAEARGLLREARKMIRCEVDYDGYEEDAFIDRIDAALSADQPTVNYGDGFGKCCLCGLPFHGTESCDWAKANLIAADKSTG